MDDNVSQPWRNYNNWMKTILFLILLPFSIFSQQDTIRDTVKVSIDNSINGSYTKYSNNSNIVNVGFVGDNSLNYRNFKFNTTTNYSLSFRDSITANEFVEKTNVEFDNIFLFNVYTNSLIRSIKNDNSFGVGYGHKFSIKKLDASLSYAVLYQKTFYESGLTKEIARNSLRTKIKYNGDLVGFSTEFYYQPSFKSMKTDYIVYGNAKIIFLPKKRVNFILQDAINYISTSKVRMLHNLAFGVEYSFKN
jgi:hypothetical protein